MITHNVAVADAVLDALSMQLQGSQVQELSRTTPLLALQIDSLGIAAILAHVEQLLGFRFSSEQLVWCYEVNTVDELIAAIERAHRGER